MCAQLTYNRGAGWCPISAGFLGDGRRHHSARWPVVLEMVTRPLVVPGSAIREDEDGVWWNEQVRPFRNWLIALYPSRTD